MRPAGPAELDDDATLLSCVEKHLLESRGRRYCRQSELSTQVTGGHQAALQAASR